MSKIPESWKLNLPEWSDADEPPPLSLPEIIAICEKMLPIWNAARFKKPAPPIPTEPFSLVESKSQARSDNKGH